MENKLPEEPKTLVDFYDIRRLTQIIDAEILKITVAGFTEIINSPITILEPKDSGGVTIWEGSNITAFLPKECEVAREKDGGRACIQQREMEMREFVNDLGASPVCYCFDRGMHLRKPIQVGRKVVALALGGNYRIEGASSTRSIENYIEYLSKVLSVHDKEVEKIAFSGTKIKVRKYDGSYIDENSLRQEYNLFVGKMKAIEELGEEVFRARRLAHEGAFLSELFGVTKFGYTASTNIQEFKDMLVSALSKINEFCGFNKSLLLISKEDETVFRPLVSVGFPKWVGTNITELQIDKEWDNFIHNERIVFMSKDLDINKVPYNLFLKGKYDIRRLIKDIQILAQAPEVRCSFAYPVVVSRDYKGVFIFVNESQEILYVSRSIKETKDFLDRVMEHLSTILRRHHAQIVSRMFFDRLSHEILTPVYVVRNRAEFLQKRFYELPDYLRRTKFNDLVQECNRLVVLTEGFSILDSSKRVTLNRRLTDICHEIVKPTVFLLRPEAQKKRIYIRYDEEIFNIPRLSVDPDKVKQVFYNIITNAIKYSYPDTEISIGYRITQNGYEFFVRNYGIGIPKGEENRIFEVGAKGSNAAQLDARGAGMGLAICKEMIRAHDGRIWFERGIEKGQLKEITFWFLLPKALQE
jgi:signal transduction histidine kinase